MERDTETLLAYLRAQRDDAEEQAANANPTVALWLGGAVAAYERAIVAITRWEQGQDPDPSKP